MRVMRPHKMVSEYLILMFFSQPVKQLSDCGCKLDCGRLASVCEERRAAQCLFKFVVLEAQHDAVLRVGGYPAVLHLLGRLEYKSFLAHCGLTIRVYDSVGGVRLVLRAETAIPARHNTLSVSRV